MQLYLTEKQKELLIVCLDAVLNAHDRGDADDFMDPLNNDDLADLEDFYNSLDEQIEE